MWHRSAWGCSIAATVERESGTPDQRASLRPDHPVMGGAVRTVEQIDYALTIETAILTRELRGGRASRGVADVWTRVDALLDERLSVVVRDLPGAPPRHEHGHVV
jgi:tagatose-1,6-bisphosphate aldolase non-catalytic subunit AgaZ/GatZ